MDLKKSLSRKIEMAISKILAGNAQDDEESTADAEKTFTFWKRIVRWRDNFGKWVLFAGGVFGLIAFFNPYFERDPSLATTILSNDALLLKGAANPAVEIRVNGKPIENPEEIRVLRFRVQNMSDGPINPEDYRDDEPFALFLNGYDLLAAGNVTQASAERLFKSVDPEPAKITDVPAIAFQEALLNPGDWFVAEAWVLPIKGSQASLRLGGAISGVKLTPAENAVGAPVESGGYHLPIASIVAVLIAIALFQHLSAKIDRSIVKKAKAAIYENTDDLSKIIKTLDKEYWAIRMRMAEQGETLTESRLVDKVLEKVHLSERLQELKEVHSKIRFIYWP